MVAFHDSLQTDICRTSDNKYCIYKPLETGFNQYCCIDNQVRLRYTLEAPFLKIACQYRMNDGIRDGQFLLVVEDESGEFFSVEFVINVKRFSEMTGDLFANN